MFQTEDHELLARFARGESETAFATVVNRYGNLVYSTTLRCTGNAHHAEEITQVVFIILARKAGRLSSRVVLSGWLYQTARLAAANFMKAESRRQHREQEAYMQSTVNEPNDDCWREIAPLLDDAMGRLGQVDRDVVVMRYFENKSAAEIGTALHMNEDAARRRVNRAVEKLHRYFHSRGVSSSAGIVAGAISDHSVHAAPAALIKSIQIAAVAKGSGAAVSTLTLVKETMKLTTWLKIKTAVFVGAGVILAAGGTIAVTKAVAQSNHVSVSVDESVWTNQFDSRIFVQLPETFILRPTKFSNGGGLTKAVDSSGAKIYGRAVPLRALASFAYGVPADKIVIDGPAPDQKFDVLITVTEDPQGQLQLEIKRLLGLVGRHVTRHQDVLYLSVARPGASGLKVHLTDADVGNAGGGMSGDGVIKFQNASMRQFIGNIRGYFDMPIIDQTGLTAGYDISLRWPKALDGVAQEDAMKASLLEQLGLALTPAQEDTDALVMEKAQ